MERRPKPVTRKQSRSVDQHAAGQRSVVDPVSLPHIADFIDYGESISACWSR